MGDYNEWHTAISAGRAILAAKKVGLTPKQIDDLITEMTDTLVYDEPKQEEASQAYLHWLADLNEDEIAETKMLEAKKEDDIISWLVQEYKDAIKQGK